MNTINYASVDWITATTKRDKIGLLWYEIFQRWLKFKGTTNLYNERWSNGYYGGIESEGLRWGFNDNLGYILIASSDTAAWLWKHIDPKPKKVTRLDLCVDILHSKPINLADVAYETIIGKIGDTNRKYALYANNHGGATLYVGSRQSQQFGRLYDKGVESGSAKPGILWRYEVEYKKPLSSAVTEKMALLESSDLEKEITNRVGAWFVERGVEAAREMVSGDVTPILAQKTITTVDRKLGWLRTQVQPTVHQLIEAGHGVDVLHSLMLTAEQVTEIMTNET